jgi:hypothetical protein
MDASKVVSRVPTLRKFILKLDHDDIDYHHVSRTFELWYLKAGMPRTTVKPPMDPIPDVRGDAAYLNRNRLYWRVHHWEPWDEVQFAWGALVGPDAKIVFLNEDKWKFDNTYRISLPIYEGEF